MTGVRAWKELHMSAGSVFNMEEALERVDHDHETFQMMGGIPLE